MLLVLNLSPETVLIFEVDLCPEWPDSVGFIPDREKTSLKYSSIPFKRSLKEFNMF